MVMGGADSEKMTPNVLPSDIGRAWREVESIV
jgi:hypothetical protein